MRDLAVCFSICWRPLPHSPVPAAPALWWPNPRRQYQLATMIRCTGFISGNRTCGNPLNIREIKTVPDVPRSHPVVERLIGTVRAARMSGSQCCSGPRPISSGSSSSSSRYYNEHRTHAGRAGRPPALSLDAAGARASLRAYRRQPHCHGLYHTPRAA